MKKFTLALALAGAVGLAAGCGAGSSGEETGKAPVGPGNSNNVVAAPIAKARGAAADLEAAAAEKRTVNIAIEGMT